MVVLSHAGLVRRAKIVAPDTDPQLPGFLNAIPAAKPRDSDPWPDFRETPQTIGRPGPRPGQHWLVQNGDIMTASRSILSGDRIVDPILALARCSKEHRILVAGSKAVELMFELHRRGFARAAATTNCGRPASQYDVALVDWRSRTSRALETTLDWLVEFLSPGSVLVVWVDAQKSSANQNLRDSLERRGFVVESGIDHDCGRAVSARRREMNPIRRAA